MDEDQRTSDRSEAMNYMANMMRDFHQKQDVLLEKVVSIDARFVPYALASTDHESRITRLERQAGRATGAVAASVFLAGLAGWLAEHYQSVKELVK